jgi:hypothetical protein
MLYAPPPQNPGAQRPSCTSRYLSVPLRSLEQACRDVAGCAGGSVFPCVSCPLADICPGEVRRRSAAASLLDGD